MLGEIETEEMVLTVERMACAVHYAVEEADDMGRKATGDRAATQLRYTLDASILAAHVETFTVKAVAHARINIPAAWTDVVKQRWAPEWFLRRWPVEWRVVEDRQERTASYEVKDVLVDPPAVNGRQFVRLVFPGGASC